jgi:hypothetical protein
MALMCKIYTIIRGLRKILEEVDAGEYGGR